MRLNPNFEKPTQRFFEKKQAKITKRSSSNPALRESPNQFYNVKTGIRQRFGLKRRTEPKTSNMARYWHVYQEKRKTTDE